MGTKNGVFFKKNSLVDEAPQSRKKIIDTKSYYVTLSLSKEDTDYYCNKSSTVLVKDKDGKTWKLIADTPSAKNTRN